jgi:hypothetical protein
MKVVVHFNLDDARFMDPRGAIFEEAASVLCTVARNLELVRLEYLKPGLMPIVDGRGQRIGEYLLTDEVVLKYATCAAAEQAFGRTMIWREEHERYVGYFDRKSTPVVVVHKRPREGNPGV